MADEEAGGAPAGGGDSGPSAVKCPPCPPTGAPAWMATFSDLVTLLLTFFVLLLSFAKTETAKYEAALGSIRNAFGGNVLKQGEVLTPGKSPDDSPTMIDSTEPIKPFPIEFLTMEGLLDKHEVNRESTEDLNDMKNVLYRYGLTENVDVYELTEGVLVAIKDHLYFENGSTKLVKGGVAIEVFEKLIKLMRENNWKLYVEGHSSKGESGGVGRDALMLSSLRAMGVTRTLIKKGINAKKISTLYYGDSRPSEGKGQRSGSVDQKWNRRVEFLMRKTDLRTKGRKVQAR